jgi:hypothetical protein
MAIKDQTLSRADLIRDLLDPDLDTTEIARRHAVDPADLRAVVRSPAFRAAAAAIHEVDQTRTAALLPAHKARAVRRLATIAAQPAETTAQHESARRAATALIRCKADPLPDPDPAGDPESAAPDSEDLVWSALRADAPNPSAHPANNETGNPAPGCRADGAAFCTSSPPSPHPTTRTVTRTQSAAAQLRARAGSPSG